MIRTVRVDAGEDKISFIVDTNLWQKNVWTRIGENSMYCPKTGFWEVGKNSGYTYLKDEKGEDILILSFLGTKVGEKGLGEFRSNKYAISKHLLLGWEILKVTEEWHD